MTNLELSARFFLAVAAVLAACRVVGLVTTRLRQPPVLAEMIAGILLGPTLLGLVMGGEAVPAGVPSFVRKWRARNDSNVRPSDS